MALIEIEKLKKQYSKDKIALKSLDLSLESGKIIGLLGSNGSGKTTLIKILAGLLSPTEGSVLIDGLPIGAESKAIVSYLPDVSYIREYHKITQVLDFFQDFYPDFHRDRAEKMLDILSIDQNSRYKSLSKGMKEKVQLILVMSRDAKLYLLDEPIAGVDPASRDYILNTILKNYNPNSTILITTHLIADIESILDEVIFIRDGTIELVSSVSAIKEKEGMTIDAYFREVFRCSY